MARLEIRLLGGFSMSLDGRRLDHLPLRAARSLLAFLVMNRDRAHTRDLLAGMFWPDFDEPKARRRLSQALWQIQSVIGDSDGQRQYIVGTADTVRFDPEADFALDVDQFEQALGSLTGTEPAERDLATALDVVSLYTGDLLAGFYDDWLFADQDRLRSGFLTALRTVVDLAMAKGDLDTALGSARRIAQEDEFDEEAHRTVMRIAVLLGRHNEAIRQFEECRRIMEQELGASPSPETVALYEATLADRESTATRPAPGAEESPLFGTVDRIPFVGRDAERSRIAAMLDAALDGNSSIVLVEGESGVGKTRLLTEIAEDARWRGMDVLWGRSAPSGGRPFAPIAEALGAITGLRSRQLAARLDPPWLDALEPLIPTLDAGTSSHRPEQPRRAEDRDRMQEAISVAFTAMAAITPTVVVLEDVHWADEDTLQAIQHLAERLDGDRLVVAITYRHGEARDRGDVWKLVRSIDRHEYCERVSLTPYSPAQTEELIRRSLSIPEVAQDFSERMHRDTGGIPLFIVETLRALYEKDDLARAEADAEEAPALRDRLPVTPTMHALIRHRLEGLDPASRETLELIATHDGDLLLEEVVAASALDDQGSLAAVDDLLRRRLLVGGERSFQVEHELMRRVVYDDLPLSRRLELHRRIAGAIEQQRPTEVELLAHHFSTARIPDRAADYLERAAEHALVVHAYETAALHLGRAVAALAEIGAPDERQFAAASLLEEVLDVLGRREEQEHALQSMDRHAGPLEKTDVLRRRAWWLANQDRFQEAEEAAHQALETAHEVADGGRIVAALTTAGMIACFAGRAADGVRLLEEAAEVHGADQRQEADARNALGQNLIDLQRFGEAESQLLSALTLYESLGDARGQAEVLGMLGTLRMERGEPESAETAFERAIDIARRIGYRHGEAVCQMNLAILRVITNRLGDALEAFDAAADTYRAMGNRRGLALVQSNAAWLWHALLGDPERARGLIDDALRTYVEIGDARGEAQCLAMHGSIDGRAGKDESAQEQFERALDLTLKAGDWWLTAQALREFAYFELETGRTASGIAHAQEAERLCNEYGMNDLVVGIRALLGRLHLQEGEMGKAMRAAESAMKEMRPGIELAHVIPFSFAEVLLAAGEREKAKRMFGTAYDLLHQTLKDLPSELRDSALRNVPHNAQLADRWRELNGAVDVFYLPSADAPLGRTLTDQDLVEVMWTTEHPADLAVADRIERRRAQIVRLVGEARDQGASPTVEDLARALGASPVTIRRDLSALRDTHPDLATRGSRSAT